MSICIVYMRGNLLACASSMYLDHDYWSTSFVEVRCNLGQQHTKPTIDMLQVVRITGPQMHLAAPNYLHVKPFFCVCFCSFSTKFCSVLCQASPGMLLSQTVCMSSHCFGCVWPPVLVGPVSYRQLCNKVSDASSHS